MCSEPVNHQDTQLSRFHSKKNNIFVFIFLLLYTKKTIIYIDYCFKTLNAVVERYCRTLLLNHVNSNHQHH